MAHVKLVAKSDSYFNSFYSNVTLSIFSRKSYEMTISVDKVNNTYMLSQYVGVMTLD